MTIVEGDMASKLKVTVSVDMALARELVGASWQRGKPRCRRRLEEELKEGYLAMAKADRATAERHLAAGWEVVK